MSNSDSLARFTELTGCNDSRANHYLEAYQWDLDAAVSAYLDSVEDNVEEAPIQVSANNSSRVNRSNIATFNTLNRESESPSSDDDEQAYYVGGAEHGGSGQQVLAGASKFPSKKGPHQQGPPPPSYNQQATSEYVKDMFEVIRKHGAVEASSDSLPQEGTSSGKGSATVKPFSGQGHVLGAANSSSKSSVLKDPLQQEESNGRDRPINLIVRMWANGFTVCDGPLRDYSEPGSQLFLSDIQQGIVPRELEQMAGSQGNVRVMLQARPEEDFTPPPKPTFTAFSGTGSVLGRPIPTMTVSPATTNSSPVLSSTASESTTPMPSVDDSLPVTQLQVRLPDGQRIVVKLNESHTVADVRRAIMSQRGDLESRPFALMTSYPPKKLTNDNATLKDAGLLQSSLLLKYD